MAALDISGIKLKPARDIFGEPDPAPEGGATQLALSELHPYHNHHYRVVDNDEMRELVESISENGILVPGIARPREDGGYEIIAGHRRAHAARLAGLSEMPMFVRDYDDDEADIVMVDTNRQRERLLPSEKAWGYRIRLDAMKRQGKRTDLTSATMLQKSESDWMDTTSATMLQKSANKTSRELLAETSNESHEQIRRYIRLTYLTPELLRMVDGEDEYGEALAMNAAVNISYLTEAEQRGLYLLVQASHFHPSIKQSKLLREESDNGTLTDDRMIEILSDEPMHEPRIIFQRQGVARHFPEGTTREDMQTVMWRLLENFERRWKRRQMKGENANEYIGTLLSGDGGDDDS